MSDRVWCDRHVFQHACWRRAAGSASLVRLLHLYQKPGRLCPVSVPGTVSVTMSLYLFG